MSPIACVLVECSALYSAKWEQQQERNNFDKLHVQHKNTVKVGFNIDFL